MLKEYPHSVFDAPADTITNTINTEGVMGAGLALEFRLRFPSMFRDYRERCRRGQVVPGRPYIYSTPGTLRILNFPTKADWRHPSKMAWIREGLEWISENHASRSIETLALPKLGANQGGLPWPEVEGQISEVLGPEEIEVWICLDRSPAPGGSEAKMMERLSGTTVEELVDQAGIRRDIAKKAVEADIARFRELLQVKGVGERSYEKLFRYVGRRLPGGAEKRMSDGSA